MLVPVDRLGRQVLELLVHVLEEKVPPAARLGLEATLFLRRFVLGHDLVCRGDPEIDVVDPGQHQRLLALEDELDAPKHLARDVHRLYFDPQHEEFAPRTFWSMCPSSWRCDTSFDE